MTKRRLKEDREYEGQIRVYRYFLGAIILMMVTSLIFTLLGFFWLISNHVDQAVRMSKIKNL